MISTIQLSTLIHQIRAAQSAEEEDRVITTELANIRTYIRECDPELRPRVIAKLVYLSMIGRQAAFAHTECLNLMADSRFSFKRIGYLGASLLIDETTEMSVLVTHTLEKDLNSNQRFVVALALALVANIGSTELCRSLAPAVHKVMQIDDPFLRKRGAMAVIRVVKKLPELVEQFQACVHLLLIDHSHSVVLSGIGMVVQMLKSAPQLSATWARFTPAFVNILRALIASSRTSDEASDPFLQVKVLEVIALLKSPSDDLDEVLASIVSSADMKRSDGRAVLLEAVQTIVAVGKKSSLRTLAFNQIGRLLTFRESNVLYSALNVFSRVLYAHRDILDRTGSDVLALQRYKAQIVKCLDNPDISIRRRALDVISALIDGDSAERLVPEILKYLHLADADFRMELIGRIFGAIQRFSPNPQWNFDSILQILRESGGYVRNDIIAAVCRVVGNSEAMQTYAISKLQPILAEESTVQPLVQVASWILGEYGVESHETEETLARILVLPQTTSETKGYLLTALAKLAARSHAVSPLVLETLASESRSNDLDIQQRSGEFIQLLTQTTQGESVLAVAPPVKDDDEDQVKPAPPKPAPADLDNWLPSAAPAQTGDLLGELLGDVAPAPKPVPTVAPVPQAVTPAVAPVPQAVTPAVAPVPQAVAPPATPAGVEAFNSGDLQIFFEIQRKPSNPNQVAIRASAYNKSAVPITGLLIEYAAPEGWVARKDPPNGDSLAPNQATPIQQITYWNNSGVKTPAGLQLRPLQMSLRVSYKFGSMPFQEVRPVNPRVFG
jgi:hypothetical protein